MFFFTDKSIRLAFGGGYEGSFCQSVPVDNFGRAEECLIRNRLSYDSIPYIFILFSVEAIYKVVIMSKAKRAQSWPRNKKKA